MIQTLHNSEQRTYQFIEMWNGRFARTLRNRACWLLRSWLILASMLGEGNSILQSKGPAIVRKPSFICGCNHSKTKKPSIANPALFDQFGDDVRSKHTDADNEASMSDSWESASTALLFALANRWPSRSQQRTFARPIFPSVEINSRSHMESKRQWNHS